jgi:hypothetical protein
MGNSKLLQGTDRTGKHRSRTGITIKTGTGYSFKPGEKIRVNNNKAPQLDYPAAASEQESSQPVGGDPYWIPMHDSHNIVAFR